MTKQCKCNPHKAENEPCSYCGKQQTECICDNVEISGLKDYYDEEEERG